MKRLISKVGTTGKLTRGKYRDGANHAVKITHFNNARESAR